MSSSLDDHPDLYEHEMLAARNAMGELQARYAHETNMGDEKVQQRFIREAKGIFAEKAGLVITCTFEPEVSSNEGDNSLYWLPQIGVIGRVDKVKEFDHDRQKHEIRAGLFDGVKGVIDPNTGLMREEPKSKLIL